MANNLPEPGVIFSAETAASSGVISFFCSRSAICFSAANASVDIVGSIRTLRLSGVNWYSPGMTSLLKLQVGQEVMQPVNDTFAFPLIPILVAANNPWVGQKAGG